MQLVVNPSDELPIYRQIMRQITEAIAVGRLKAAPLTVKKAYDEMEALGYIETRRGRGTFVCATLPPVDRNGQLDRLNRDARKLLAQAYLAGLGLPEVMDILRGARRDLAQGPAEEKEKA